MGYHKPPQIREPQKAGVNSRIVQNALSAWNLPKIDTKDTKAVEKRISDYLQYCIDKDITPSVAGCSNWLGISNRTLEYWLQGQRATPEHQRIATAFYGVLQEVWAQDMKMGNINPVSGIFIGKVFFGYKDTQEIVISPKQHENELTTEELIAESRMLPGAEKLALPFDFDEKEDAERKNEE